MRQHDLHMACIVKKVSSVDLCLFYQSHSTQIFDKYLSEDNWSSKVVKDAMAY